MIEGNAVASANRPARVSSSSPEVGKASTQSCPGIEAAGEVAQQVEGLGENVVAQHRLKLGNVERGRMSS